MAHSTHLLNNTGEVDSSKKLRKKLSADSADNTERVKRMFPFLPLCHLRNLRIISDRDSRSTMTSITCWDLKRGDSRHGFGAEKPAPKMLVRLLCVLG